MEEDYSKPKWRRDTPLNIDKDTHDYMKSQIHHLVDRFLKPQVLIKLGKWIDRGETAIELCTVLELTIFNFLVDLRLQWKRNQAQAGNLPLGEVLPKRLT